MNAEQSFEEAKQHTTNTIAAILKIVENSNPENVDWGYVGDLNYVDQKLGEILETVQRWEHSQPRYVK